MYEYSYILELICLKCLKICKDVLSLLRSYCSAIVNCTKDAIFLYFKDNVWTEEEAKPAGEDEGQGIIT